MLRKLLLGIILVLSLSIVVADYDVVDTQFTDNTVILWKPLLPLIHNVIIEGQAFGNGTITSYLIDENNVYLIDKRTVLGSENFSNCMETCNISINHDIF